MNLIFIFNSANRDQEMGHAMLTFRRPAGLVGRKPQGARSALGDYLAREARMLSASAAAFRSLSDALFAAGAPCALTGRAACAANDRSRDAELVTRLAARYGGRPSGLRVVAKPPGTLVEIATDNAAEGCVRDTYAALVARWQAEHATSRPIAEAMGSIARDGLRHAALAWALLDWTLPQLSKRDQARTRRAIPDAVARLEHAVRQPDPVLVRRAGLPTRAEQRALIAELERALWDKPRGARRSRRTRRAEPVTRGRVGRPPARWGRLALYIEQTGLSRQQMAGDLGISRKFLDNICREVRRPGPELAERIEQRTRGKVTVSYLMALPKHDRRRTSGNHH